MEQPKLSRLEAFCFEVVAIIRNTLATKNSLIAPLRLHAGIHGCKLQPKPATHRRREAPLEPSMALNRIRKGAPHWAGPIGETEARTLGSRWGSIDKE